jgi:hypothetical protein
MSKEIPIFLAALALIYTGMALDPNTACAGVARYLLGAGPMLPPTQDLALAQLHRALNGGAFEHPWNANLPLHRVFRRIRPHHHIAGVEDVEERRRCLNVHLPYECGN